MKLRMDFFLVEIEGSQGSHKRSLERLSLHLSLSRALTSEEFTISSQCSYLVFMYIDIDLFVYTIRSICV